LKADAAATKYFVLSVQTQQQGQTYTACWSTGAAPSSWLLVSAWSQLGQRDVKYSLNCHVTSFRTINSWTLGKQRAERAS